VGHLTDLDFQSFKVSDKKTKKKALSHLTHWTWIAKCPAAQSKRDCSRPFAFSLAANGKTD